MDYEIDKKSVILSDSESDFQPEEIASDSTTSSFSIKTEWTPESRECLLKLIEERGYVRQLLENNAEEIYLKLSNLMTIMGYDYTQDDIRTEWTKLLNKYNEGTKFEGYEDLHKIFNDGKDDPTTEVVIAEQDPCEDVCFKKRWSDKETRCLLDAMRTYGLPTGHRLRKSCHTLQEILKRHGFDRTIEQIIFRVKNLKAIYAKVKNKVLSKEQFPYYAIMKVLWGDKTPLDRKLLKNLKVARKKSGNISKSRNDKNAYSGKRKSRIAKSKRNWWSDEETLVLLEFIKLNDITTGIYNANCHMSLSNAALTINCHMSNTDATVSCPVIVKHRFDGQLLLSNIALTVSCHMSNTDATVNFRLSLSNTALIVNSHCQTLP